MKQKRLNSMGVSRENRPSEETFRLRVWGILPNLQNCLWFGKTLTSEAIEYSKQIRAALEEMEKQIVEETEKGFNKY